MTEELDLAIIGGGPAGMSAGIYSAVYNLDAKIIAKETGGTVLDAHEIVNYPGLGKIKGEELADKLEEHLNELDVLIDEREVEKIEKKGNGFEVITEEGEYESKTIVIATGTKVRELDVPGEKEYRGKGVSYCAVCDAALYKDAVVGVVGGSEAAAKEALLLSQHAEKVYIIYRGEKIHPLPILRKRIDEKIREGEIEVINNTNVVEVKGDQLVEKVKLDNPYKGNEELELDGLFVSIGGVPLTSMAEDLDMELNDSGEIEVDEEMKTNVPGAYAAGDVTDNSFRQVITAAYQGSRAVNTAYEYLKEE